MKKTELDSLIEDCEGILDALSEPRRKLIIFLKYVSKSGGTEPAETPPAPSSTRPEKEVNVDNDK